MAKSQRKKKISKEQNIATLRKELGDNDELYKKNTEQYDTQVMLGLYKKGYPQAAPLYSTFIEKLKLDIEETQIALDSDMVVVNPMFAFHINPRWIEIQQEKQKKQIEIDKENLVEVEKLVDEVKSDIVAQNGRIKERRVQILEDLAGLGEDVSELKASAPNYIG